MADSGIAGDLPQDAKVVIEILKSMGVDDYEPRVVNQLLEFMYRKSMHLHLLEYKPMAEEVKSCSNVLAFF